MTMEAIAPAGKAAAAKAAGDARQAAGALAALALLAAAPFFASPYTLTVLGTFIAYAIALLGFNLLLGYCGLLSFGHAMFIAIGAYTAAAYTKLGLPYLELTLLTAMAACAIAAFLIGLFCVRYTKIFFGMLTLAFGMTFHSFLFKFYNVTGGDQGMRVGRPLLAGFDFAGGKTAFLTGPFYYYALILLCLFGFLAWRIVHSPFGLQLRAARDNPQKAAYLGVEVHRVRLWAFVISALYCGIAGVLIGVGVGLADPELGYWTQSGNLVFMTILGGSGVFGGPVLGAFVFVFLQDFLVAWTEYWRFVLGAILVAIVVFFPEGLAGLLLRLRRRES
ncbi:MAG TPA: branched-chain amino acid ABC transporter permease [Hyphomicrobiales bacterium]|nr:branched-chain amino acid ABC transporter permease [Hyphomicrobiales bacterium]